jgi:ATP-binding cassette, subfamily B, bacterial
VGHVEPYTREYGSFTIYGRLALQARPYWAHALGYLLLSLLATPLALLVPVPLKIALDTVIGSRPLPPLLSAALPTSSAPPAAGASVMLLVAALVVGIALLTQLHQLVTDMLKTYVGEKLLFAFRSRLFRHVQQLSFSFSDRRGTSDSVYRIQYDATAIQAVVVEGIVPLVGSLATLAGMFYVTARINLKLAAIAAAVCAPLLLTTWVFRRSLRRQWRDVKRLESSAQAVVHEALGAARVVKAFGREDREHRRFERESRSGMSARLRAGFRENCYSLLVGLITAGGAGAVLYFGLREVTAGTLSVGNLLVVVTYVGKLYDPIKTLGRQLTTRERAMASAERALALLDESPDVHERPGAKPITRAAGAVSFRDVRFAYPGAAADAPVLRGVSLEVPPGTRVGIAGQTGAGKTTLIQLLCRFYDPTAGQILLDGTDLRDYRLADLRNQFAVVLQEPVLFSTTIAENIAYGRPGASAEDVVAAAKAANAHHFITALPDGYDTQVGERGMCLSGGERQRVSLARAFLRDAAVLILDEPTSSVDLKTEAQIMEAMERLMRGRTAFMIAHRPATLDGCDLLLKIEDGRLVSKSHVAPSRLRHQEVMS